MADSSQYGAFVPSNYIWDIQLVQQSNNVSPEVKELLIRLYQNIGLIALVLNVKDTAMYDVLELVNGQLWFPNPNNNSTTAQDPAQRQVLRTVIDFGPLPNATTTSVPHNIVCTSATTFTRIYAAASDTTGLNYVPIPYSSSSGTSNIELKVDSVNVNITTASNRSNFNVCYVIVEYIQS